MDDLIVVPHGGDFYVARVSGPAVYLAEKSTEDTSYRRNVAWLNDRQPLSRTLARAALLSRMKIQGTCASASDLINEIQEVIELAAGGEAPTFYGDLQRRLIPEVLAEIRSGRMESFGFERLIQTVLIGLGAEQCRIVPRQQDKGADLIAMFRVAGAFQYSVAVQAKHCQHEPAVDRLVIEQLIRGIEAEMADLGMVITSESFSDEAKQAAQQYFDEKGIRIELVDGEEFAKLIVENGIGISHETR
ncbi:MAG TPA: restriction endonuclease [Pyrinomonadaceae bacterium]|nr:restriction endonuclease [Pyrinomonadaceae bacterium]